jgi:hypothetical protein
MTKETGKNVLSVILGVLTGAAIFTIAGLILVLTSLPSIKGDTEESGLGNLAGILEIVPAILVALSSFMGGYVTAKISTKKDMVHGLITGLVLLGLFVYINEIDFAKDVIIYYLIIIPLTLLGTYFAIWKKRKNII